MKTIDYVIVSPIRNEEPFIQGTIDSVVAQHIRPSEWLIVDDGSTDGTWSILEAAARKHDWIRPLKRADRGYRQSGAGVVEAFYDGFRITTRSDWQFLAKLDGDLTFSPDYFSDCLSRFQRQPRLGIGGGNICTMISGALESEAKRDPHFHVRGAVKIYRRECWDAIGGIIRGPCWDSIDELKANMLEWKTQTFKELKVHHHRPAGQAFGWWKDLVKGGRGNYVTGYHPVFMLLKCLGRLRQKPYGLAAFGLFYGYFAGYFTRTSRLVDKDLMAYIRAQQVRYVTGRASLWRE